MKFASVRRQRKPLAAAQIGVPPGIRVLPEDVREWQRQLENLPRRSASSSCRGRWSAP
jgi:hypothetical protein